MNFDRIQQDRRGRRGVDAVPGGESEGDVAGLDAEELIVVFDLVGEFE